MSDKKKCTAVMDSFLALDRNERIPLWVTKHLLTCNECRNCVRMFTRAEKILEDEGMAENPFTYAALSDVKERLYPGSTKEKFVPVAFWLVIGIVLVSCMILGSFFISRFLPSLQEFSFIFVAGILTAYCLTFVGLNMDLFIKKSSRKS